MQNYQQLNRGYDWVLQTIIYSAVKVSGRGNFRPGFHSTLRDQALMAEPLFAIKVSSPFLFIFLIFLFSISLIIIRLSF